MSEYKVIKHPILDDYVIDFTDGRCAGCRGLTGADLICRELNKLQARVEELEAENEKMRAHIDEGLGIIEESIEGIPPCQSIIPWLKDYLIRSVAIADAKKEPNP